MFVVITSQIVVPILQKQSKRTDFGFSWFIILFTLINVKIAVEKGKSVRSDIHLGVCGEHGGDPASIEFCESVGLDYVSCSPYRVPIARLAAAQATIKSGK